MTANPERALAQMTQANVASSRYTHDLALSHIKKALELDPLNARAYISYSHILDALHDWPTAKEAAVKAIELEPDFHLWKPVLGFLVFYNDGDSEAALEIAAPFIQVLPNDPAVIPLVVDIAAELNEWAKALEGCRKMVSVDSPETPYSYGYDCLAKISIRMEDFQAAERYQDKTEEVASDDQLGILSNRVLLLNNAGECEQSRAVAQKWLHARPYSLSAQIMLGIGYMCSDNYEEAILIREKVVERWPTSVNDVYLLAISYAYNGMESKAFETLENIEYFAFEDPLYYLGLNEISFYRGDGEAAIEYARKEVELRPCCSALLESLAFAHLYMGNTQAAQVAAESAMAKGSTSSFVTGMLRYIHLVHGNKEAAEPLLVHSLGKNPNSYLTRYSLAEFYLAEHRCEEGEPHVNWLFDFLEDEAEKVSLVITYQECYENRPTQEVVQN